mmetsp:Transcript_10389/g.8675  ORF Transcript_10389/g.8675 Transcript_10389/m.8675 type:complete len:96 (-) Transcript_10389:5-292(-)
MGCASSKDVTLDKGNGPIMIRTKPTATNAAAASATPVSTKDGSDIAGRRRYSGGSSSTEQRQEQHNNTGNDFNGRSSSSTPQGHSHFQSMTEDQI